MTTKTKEKEKKVGSSSEEGVHVFKTTLAGNGDLYGWKELDENGELVRESVQTYNSEADAEKAIRTLAGTKHIVEVINVKNINAEANINVNLIKKSVSEDNFGMHVVSRSVEIDVSVLDEGAPREEHPNVEKMAEIDPILDEKVEELREEKEERDAVAAEKEEKRLAAEEKEAKKAEK